MQVVGAAYDRWDQLVLLVDQIPPLQLGDRLEP